MPKSKVGCVHQIRDAESNLNILEQTLSISEPVTTFCFIFGLKDAAFVLKANIVLVKFLG